MRLAPFIHHNLPAIVSEWESFARSLYPESAKMTRLQLRDHASGILEAVVKDLDAAQTRAAQSAKSKEPAVAPSGSPETAAETHAVLRAQSGLNIRQLFAEYRALRATVLRLWEEAGSVSGEDLQDVIRFNEAIDQAVAESIGFFDDYVERARNLLLGTLGHDMRNPLNAIFMIAGGLERMKAGEQISEAAAGLLRSGSSIRALVEDLVDFNRTQLGVGINIEPSEADLAALFAEELEEHRATHPARRIEMTVEGDAQGRWDGKRLRQVLRNLVGNACAYATPGEPVVVTIDGTGTEISFEVKNRGAIDLAAEQLFNPLNRGPHESRAANPEGLGLGLFIVREVVRAHEGEVQLRSEAGETVFSVRLPRRIRA
jgi:signal transduction histidine kinase